MVWNPFRPASETKLAVSNHPTFNIRHYGPNAMPPAPEVEMEPEDESAYRRIRDEFQRGGEADVQQLTVLKAKYAATWVERSIDVFLRSLPTSTPADEIYRPTLSTFGSPPSLIIPTSGRLLRFLAETGMGPEEVCGLEWSQVSVKRREVEVVSGQRVLPLSDVALGTLVVTPRHIISPYVFWHHDGQRHTTLATRPSPTVLSASPSGLVYR
jgi:hypothetical protein